MNKREYYLVEYIDYFSDTTETYLMVCETLEEAKDQLRELINFVCQDIENLGENMNDWRDTNGRSKEECIEKGELYVEDFFSAEIIKAEPNEAVKI